MCRSDAVVFFSTPTPWRVRAFSPFVISGPLPMAPLSGANPFSPSLLKKNIDRVIRGTLSSLGVEGAHPYSIHAFRRGSSAELKRCVSTLDQALNTVCWNSATFRAYRTFVGEEEVNIHSILMGRQGGSSEGESHVDSDPASSISSTSESL